LQQDEGTRKRLPARETQELAGLWGRIRPNTDALPRRHHLIEVKIQTGIKQALAM